MPKKSSSSPFIGSGKARGVVAPDYHAESLHMVVRHVAARRHARARMTGQQRCVLLKTDGASLVLGDDCEFGTFWFLVVVFVEVATGPL